MPGPAVDGVVALAALEHVVAALVGHDVVAVAAADFVVAEIAFEAVVAAIAVDRVVANTRDQRVVIVGAAEHDMLVAGVAQVVGVGPRGRRIVADRPVA